MRGDTEVAPPLIRLREKENTSHMGMKARSGDRKNIGVMFDTPLPALPVHTNTNSETINRTTTVYPLLLYCWHLPSQGGLADFTLDCPPTPPSTVSTDPSPETRGRGE